MAIRSVNPATGEELKRFDALSESELETKLEKASLGFREYRKRPIRERMALVARAGELLVAEKERLGKLMTLEMGKTLSSAIQEAEKCATACRYYAERGEELLARRTVKTAARESYVVYQPIGAVLAVMPWNFPFWQVFRFAAPALVAGNVGLLKHASNVPQCSLAIEEIFLRAGFPEGAFQSLLIGSARVEKLISDPRVAAVTLTGSESAGASVARAAGSAIKKTVLELGGSDPFLVMPSARVEEAARLAVQARMINNGQSLHRRQALHRPSRHRHRISSSVSCRELGALRVGNPLDPETQVGPAGHGGDSGNGRAAGAGVRAAGRRLLTGGRRLEGSAGYFYAPTVLLDPPADSPAAADEIFGPVASIFVAQDLDDALERANTSRYGLGACLWTEDAAEQRRVHRAHRSGPLRDQRHGRLGREAALRRRQALGLRARAFGGRDPGVREYQERGGSFNTVIRHQSRG